jgi:uncharacterized protein (TIGR02996 family)
MRTLFGPDHRPFPDVEPFLNAIREHPEEDTIRLALADHLQERGDSDRGDEEHAQLIRLQCEYAQTEHYTDRWFELVDLIDKGLRSYQDDPRERLKWPVLPEGVWVASLDRGIPVEVEVSTPGMLRRAGALFDHLPINALRVQTVPDVAVLLHRPEIARVRALGFEILSEGVIERLVNEVDVSRIESWSLGWGTCDDLGVWALADAVRTGAATVRALEAEGVFVPDEVAPLAEIAAGMTRGCLELSDRVVSSDVLGELTRSLPATPEHGLSQLTLYSAGRITRPLLGFARWPGAIHLEDLSLACSNVKKQGLRALAGSELFGRLRELNLSFCNGVTDESLAPFGRAHDAWDLRWLNLRGTRVTPQGEMLLRDRFPACRIVSANRR